MITKKPWAMKVFNEVSRLGDRWFLMTGADEESIQIIKPDIIFSYDDEKLVSSDTFTKHERYSLKADSTESGVKEIMSIIDDYTWDYVDSRKRYA